MTPDLYRDAKDVASVESICGTQLMRAGNRMRGECPLCGAGKGKGKAGAFSVDPAKDLWWCFGCQLGGDVVDLEHLMNSAGGETKADAARRLLGIDRPRVQRRPAPVQVHVPDTETEGWTFRHAQSLIAGSVPAAGTLVERYLIARGLRGWVLRQMLKHLRFHPMAYHSGPARSPLAAPAMIVRVYAPAGPTGGVHATYLTLDGRAKADFGDAPSKVMWGPQMRDGRPGGAWLTHPYGNGPLVTAEGIETTASYAQLLDEPCRMLAALSLDRLSGGWVADAHGLRDPDAPRPDPARPALTWPEPLAPLEQVDDDGVISVRAPAAPWGRVIIAVDHDMKPIKVKVRGATRFSTAMVSIDATRRARICAALAKASWARTTSAPVEAAVAPPGQDWNDYLQESLSA